VRLGYDAPLLAAIAGRLARAVMQDMRRGVKQQHGLASVASLHAGVVTVVQRFRSDLGLYVHLHCLVTDGAYEEQDDGELRFLAAPPPTPERMTVVLAQVHEVIRAADDDLDIERSHAARVDLTCEALDTVTDRARARQVAAAMRRATFRLRAMSSAAAGSRSSR